MRVAVISTSSIRHLFNCEISIGVVSLEID
jgi:hypothetical protein